MITVTTKVHFKRGPSGRKRIRKGEAPPVPKPRLPRIAKLMALAIRFDGLIREGKVWDQSDLARLAHVTQPRMTQIMNLLHLAPDIQEQILFLPEVAEGRDPVHEHMLRPLCDEMDWEAQHTLWHSLREEAGLDDDHIPSPDLQRLNGLVARSVEVGLAVASQEPALAVGWTEDALTTGQLKNTLAMSQ